MGYCLFFAVLLIVPFFLGVWIGRWWFALIPVVLMGIGVSYSSTLPNESVDGDWSERTAVLLNTLVFSLPMVIGAVIGKAIGEGRRQSADSN